MNSCAGCSTNRQVEYHDYFSEELYTWCTNCGNYGIHAAVKRALVAEGYSPKDVLLCFDIGCHGNGSDKIGGYVFHTLHGRVLPVAAGAAIANRKMKVVAFAGDGGTLSEGINHLIHTVRNNYDFTFILHDNSNYGLTTGQASATTPQDTPMNASPDGVTAATLNPTNLVFDLEPTFVARSFSGKIKHMTEVVRQGLKHKGFSYIEILQSCPTYNKAMTHEWYLTHTHDVAEIPGYDRFNKEMARKIGENRSDKIAIGVLYQDLNRMDYLSLQVNRQGIQTELIEEVRDYDVSSLSARFR